jgi:hypothetical protein
MPKDIAPRIDNRRRVNRTSRDMCMPRGNRSSRRRQSMNLANDLYYRFHKDRSLHFFEQKEAIPIRCGTSRKAGIFLLCSKNNGSRHPFNRQKPYRNKPENIVLMPNES